MREGLAANRIQWVAGIINGTGNFILTEMRDKGREFADVLAEAQALGYAEADPTFDVEGIDAAHKLTILASIAFGIPLQFDKAYTEGITSIEPQDVNYAESLGYRIKHLGLARKTQQGVEMRVHPTLVPERRLLANVNGVMNAVLVKGDAVGPTLFYGREQVPEPTASAVVADLVDVVRALTTDPENRVPHLAFQPGELSDLPILPMDAVETAFICGLQSSTNRASWRVLRVFWVMPASASKRFNRRAGDGGVKISLILLTRRVIEGDMMRAIAQIEKLDSVAGKVVYIRVEHLAG